MAEVVVAAHVFVTDDGIAGVVVAEKRRLKDRVRKDMLAGNGDLEPTKEDQKPETTARARQSKRLDSEQ